MKPHLNPQAGFSLVEVTMALAIMAFAFLGLFGLLPVGLQTFQSTVETTMRTQIVGQIYSMAEQAEFSNLGTIASNDPANPVRYYFDDQASKLNSSTNSIYTAEVTYTNTTLPAASAPSSKLATVRIDVYQNHGAFDPATHKPLGPKPTSMVIHLADFGKRLVSTTSGVANTSSLSSPR